MAWYNPLSWNIGKSKKSTYDALDPKITADGWNPGSSTPTPTLWEIMGLADRVNWLLKNDPFAERIINTYKSYVVGDSGIAFQAVSKTQNTELVKVAESAIVSFFDTTECDAQLTQTYAGIQGTAMREIAKQGGVFIRRRYRSASMGLTVPMQLQLITYDYLAKDYQNTSITNNIVQGIEYNSKWQPVAYYFYENNPKENYTYYQGAFDSSKVIRVKAKDICHLYKKDHGDQKLGVCWLAPIIPTLKMMANYRLNVLTKQQIQSGMTAIVQTEDASGDPNALVGKPNKDGSVSLIKRGQINRLGFGESITFPEMPDISGDSDFYQQFIRLAAIGAGLSYESVSTNLSEVNYSSARIGWQDMYKNVTDWQENLFIAQLNNKVAGWFEEGLVLAGVMSALQVDDIDFKSIKPRRIMLDPVKETNAMLNQLDAGFISLVEAIESDGRDYLKVQKQRAYDKQIQMELGIIEPEQQNTEMPDDDEDDDEE
jgi:lambda family phage portal protein